MCSLFYRLRHWLPASLERNNPLLNETPGLKHIVPTSREQSTSFNVPAVSSANIAGTPPPKTNSLTLFREISSAILPVSLRKPLLIPQWSSLEQGVGGSNEVIRCIPPTPHQIRYSPRCSPSCDYLDPLDQVYNSSMFSWMA